MYKVTYQNYFNKPSTQKSNISTMIQIRLERNSVNLKDRSVLFFLMLLRGSCDVCCEFSPEVSGSSVRKSLLREVSTVKLVIYQ